MLDKELDLLFKQTFDTFEPEVPAVLWNKITEGMDEGTVPGKKNSVKGLPVAWMAAASIVVFLAFIFWMNRSGESIKLQGKKDSNLVLHKSPVVNGPVRKAVAPVDGVRENSTPKNVISYSRTNKAVQKPGVEAVTVHATKEDAPVLVSEKPAAADVPVIEDKIQPAVLKNTFRTNTQITAPVVLATANCVDVADPYGINKQRNKIKTLGGLVNYVVSKVDKRGDKIIEFTDGDEGTELTGINLGLFKVKSKNNSINK